MIPSREEDDRDRLALRKDAEALEHSEGQGQAVRVYKSLDYYRVQLVRSALQSAGLSVYVSGDWLRSAQGEIPFLEWAPEIYVPSDHAERAVQIINELEAIEENPVIHPPWQCTHCGEEVDGVFSECWNCGRPSPSA